MGVDAASGGGGLLGGLRNLFRDPPPLPSVADRVAEVLRQIDAAPGDTVVLWVPGTSDTEVLPAAAAALEATAPGQPVVIVPYQGTWRLRESVADGEAVLDGVLTALARRRGRKRVLLAGHSQGAWIAGDVIARRGLRSAVDGVLLLAHPSMADHHYHYGEEGVIEVNAPDDVVTMPFGDHADEVVDGVDALARGHVARGLLELAGAAAHHPDLLAGWIKGQLWRLPVVGASFPSPHASGADQLLDAVRQLLARPGQARSRRSSAAAL